MLVEAHTNRGGIRWSRAFGVLAMIVVLLYALYVLLPAPSAAAHQVQPHAQRTYLALGDSLAFGYSQARFEANLPGESPEAFETGYVNDFGAALQHFRHNLRIVNDGCPGETTDSLIEGPCVYQELFPLHHPYLGGLASSQLSDALAYLAAHRGQVNPITIDIGANDALAVIEGVCKLQAACIAGHAPALFAHVSANLGLILGDLRAAAPHSQIIVLGLYNPFGSAIAGGDQLTAALNEALASVAATVDARFANPLPLFNPQGAAEQPTLCLLTNMCTAKPDIHPTDLGYGVLARVILHQYLLGLPGRHFGFGARLHIHVHRR